MKIVKINSQEVEKPMGYVGQLLQNQENGNIILVTNVPLKGCQLYTIFDFSLNGVHTLNKEGLQKEFIPFDGEITIKNN